MWVDYLLFLPKCLKFIKTDFLVILDNIFEIFIFNIFCFNHLVQVINNLKKVKNYPEAY